MLKLILSLVLLLPTFSVTPAHDTKNLQNLRKATDFDIYIPSTLDSALVYEIKVPEKPTKKADLILVSYFDTAGRYVFGLTEQRNNSIATKKVTEFNVRDNNKTTKKIKYKVTLEPHGNKVLIHGDEAWYDTYVGAPGGVLRWIQSDTYIELNTPSLSKESAIRIAESMKTVGK